MFCFRMDDDSVQSVLFFFLIDWFGSLDYVHDFISKQQQPKMNKFSIKIFNKCISSKINGFMTCCDNNNNNKVDNMWG